MIEKLLPIAPEDFNLAAGAGLLEAVISDVDEYLENYSPVAPDLERLMDIRSILATAAMGLSSIRDQVDTLIGDAMSEYRTVVAGHGQIERHKKTRRTNWHSDDLLRVVLDTRMVDEVTGEVEGVLDIVRKVWGLRGYQARLGELRKRGLDPDEWCDVDEQPGWSIRAY
jgi:hypothetical protein